MSTTAPVSPGPSERPGPSECPGPSERSRFWPVAFGLVVLSALVAWGQAPSPAASTPAADRSELAQSGADGAQVYADNCASCHGPDAAGVPGTFPPLAGNPNAADADHVATVVSEGLTGAIEVLGQTYDGAMPAVSLSDDELAAVVEYVTGLAGGSGPDEPTATTAPVDPAQAEAGEIGAGRDLFVGSTSLADGGPACAACHVAGSVGNHGGSGLGPDLTDVTDRLGGEAGLAGWLANPPTPTMSALFANEPMTEAEIADLAAFLTDAPDQDAPDDSVDTLALAGIAGALVLLAAMAVAYRGMRQTYVERLRSRAGDKS